MDAFIASLAVRAAEKRASGYWSAGGGGFPSMHAHQGRWGSSYGGMDPRAMAMWGQQFYHNLPFSGPGAEEYRSLRESRENGPQFTPHKDTQSYSMAQESGQNVLNYQKQKMELQRQLTESKNNATAKLNAASQYRARLQNNPIAPFGLPIGQGWDALTGKGDELHRHIEEANTAYQQHQDNAKMLQDQINTIDQEAKLHSGVRNQALNQYGQQGQYEQNLRNQVQSERAGERTGLVNQAMQSQGNRLRTGGNPVAPAVPQTRAPVTIPKPEVFHVPGAGGAPGSIKLSWLNEAATKAAAALMQKAGLDPQHPPTLDEIIAANMLTPAASLMNLPRHTMSGAMLGGLIGAVRPGKGTMRHDAAVGAGWGAGGALGEAASILAAQHLPAGSSLGARLGLQIAGTLGGGALGMYAGHKAFPSGGDDK